MSTLALDARWVYKILPRNLWEQTLQDGALVGSPDDLRDGYIHLSTAVQVPGTLARYFAGVPDLLLIAVDPAMLGAALRYEPARGGDMFPHLYAPLPLLACRVLTIRNTPEDDWEPA